MIFTLLLDLFMYKIISQLIEVSFVGKVIEVKNLNTAQEIVKNLRKKLFIIKFLPNYKICFFSINI